MPNVFFKKAIVKSFLFHLILLTLLAIIPFSPTLKKIEYLEVSVIKGPPTKIPPKAINKNIKKNKTTSKKPNKPQNHQIKEKKTVTTKKVTPIKRKPKIITTNKKTNNEPIKTPTNNKYTNTTDTPTTTITTTNINPTPKKPSGDLRISGPISQRSVIYEINPEYPLWATEQGIETDVTLKFWVNPAGKVKKVKIDKRSGYFELDIIAKNALKQWLFNSLDKNAPQKDQWGIIVIKYRLE